MATPLHRTIVTFWSEHDPRNLPEHEAGRMLQVLAREAEDGDAYCSDVVIELFHPEHEDVPEGAREFFADPLEG
jgi:hypothetical protein